LKKEAKTFANAGADPPASPRQPSNSFLVLFFKKELLPLAKHKPESFSVFSRAPTCYRCATKIQRAQ
jgi:hypothetical protein